MYRKNVPAGPRGRGYKRSLVSQRLSGLHVCTEPLSEELYVKSSGWRGTSNVQGRMAKAYHLPDCGSRMSSQFFQRPGNEWQNADGCQEMNVQSRRWRETSNAQRPMRKTSILRDCRSRIPSQLFQQPGDQWQDTDGSQELIVKSHRWRETSNEKDIHPA